VTRSALWANAASDGFALVEALASLVIVGMIGLLLVSGLTTGRQVWRRVDAREAAGEALDAAQAALRDRLEQAYPMTLLDTNPPDVDFRGSSESLEFLANAPEAARPGPLRRYRLSLDAAGELVLASASDIAPGMPADTQMLVAGVRQLEIGYFGAARPDEQRRWRGAWRFEPALPELVRVRVTFEPDDPRRWPDLIIRPRTTIDTLCRLNQASHRCKARA